MLTYERLRARSHLPDVSAIAGDVWQQILSQDSAVLTAPLLDMSYEGR